MAMVLGLIALILWANDGWYGAGWGDFGVEVNLLAAAAMLTGAASGVAFRRASERS